MTLWYSNVKKVQHGTSLSGQDGVTGKIIILLYITNKNGQSKWHSDFLHTLSGKLKASDPWVMRGK